MAFGSDQSLLACSVTLSFAVLEPIHLNNVGLGMRMNGKPIDIWRSSRYLLINENQVIDRIVLPVLGLLGWNQDDRAQVDRCAPNAGRCDIHLIQNGIILAGVECKSINSNEFCITHDKGDSRNPEHDGVVQLKTYCRTLLSQEGGNMVLPVLTNGLRWIVFNPDTFLCDSNVNNPINAEAHILADTIITEVNFLQDLDLIQRGS